MDTIGKRVASRLEELSMSQDSLADECGITQQAISDLINGKVRKPRFLLEIAQALKVTPKWLSAGVGEKTIQDIKMQSEYVLRGKVANANNVFSLHEQENIPLLKNSSKPAFIDMLSKSRSTTERHPKQYNREKCFAFEMADDSMSPKFDMSDIVYGVFDQPPAKNKYCVVEFEDGTGVPRRFIDKTPKGVVCMQLCPPKEIVYPLNAKLHSIVGSDA